MKTLKMSVSQWIAVPPNPIQRNTEKHAHKAKHLLTPTAVHAQVAAAQLPDGSYVKLDGHTRAYLWKHNQVRHPPEVHVNVFEVKTMEEAKTLYTMFDAREALETVPEKVSGAFGELQFSPQSGLLSTGGISTALRMCWSIQHGYAASAWSKSAEKNTGYTIYAAVREFQSEIFALDAFTLKGQGTKAGVIAAFLLTYRKHGPSILPFWRAVFGNAGERREGKMDSVQALNELLMQRKGVGGGGSGMYDLAARAVRAAEGWMSDDMFSAIPRPYNLECYIDRARPAITLIKAGTAAAKK